MSMKQDFKARLEKWNIDGMSVSLGLGLMALSLGVAFHSGLKYEIRDSLALNDRVVLSTITGQLTNDGVLSKVVKVRNKNQIYLEIYKLYESGQELVSKLSIPDVHDGYFHVRGESSNLMLNDIDGDSSPEIIAPSFDKDLVAHLNIFKFDKETGQFYLMTKKE